MSYIPTSNKDYINKIRSILDYHIGKPLTQDDLIKIEHIINRVIAEWNLNFSKVNSDPRNTAPYRCRLTYNKLFNSINLELLDEFGTPIPNIKY